MKQLNHPRAGLACFDDVRLWEYYFIPISSFSGGYEMAVLDRPTPDKIDSEVLSALESGEEITFPELEKRVQANLPQLANRIQVRQSAWRLVRDKRATVTRDMKLKKPS